MALRIGDTAPDFAAETTQGTIEFHEWIGDAWAVLFSHPKDFTPVCTTELGTWPSSSRSSRSATARSSASGSIRSTTTRVARDIEETQGAAVNYPMIGDPTSRWRSSTTCCRPRSRQSEVRTRREQPTVRTVFVIGPDKKIKLMLAYPMCTGRNFDEILRVLDSIQLTAKHRVATPANWKHGEDVIISGSVSNEDAKKLFPAGWKEPKPYMRIVPQPA